MRQSRSVPRSGQLLRPCVELRCPHILVGGIEDQRTNGRRLPDASLNEPLLQRSKIGNEVRPVRRVLQPRVGHPVSGNHLLWRFQIRIEDLRIPDDVGLLHRVTVAEAGSRTRLPADDSFQARPDAIGMIRRMAYCARFEDGFSMLRVLCVAAIAVAPASTSTAINMPIFPAPFIGNVLFRSGSEVARSRNVVVEVVAEPKRERRERAGRVVTRVVRIDGCADDEQVLRIPVLQMRRDDAGVRIAPMGVPPVTCVVW